MVTVLNDRLWVEMIMSLMRIAYMTHEAPDISLQKGNAIVGQEHDELPAHQKSHKHWQK